MPSRNADSTPPTPPEEALTLDEFCTGLSLKDRRVELIGAFAHVERAAGHIKDLVGAFQTRFDAFVNSPSKG